MTLKREASLIRIKHTLNTLDIANDEIPQFYNPLHYHPELELTLVEQSSGNRIVSGSVERFELLVGSGAGLKFESGGRKKKSPATEMTV